MKRSMLGWIAVGLLAGPMAGHATLVSVQGGFTTFSGCVGTSLSGIQQKLNGEQFYGGVTLCDTFGFTSEARLTFDQTASVTFQNTSLDWSKPNTANVISFAPNTIVDVSGPGVEFLLGWLTFTNGIWTDDAYFGFSLTADGGQVLGTHTFQDTLVYNLTPNNGTDKDEDADYLTFAGNLQVGQLRAYELGDGSSNTVTAEVWGHFGSLHLDSFRNPTGGGFVVPGPTPVPEPGTMALLLVGGSALTWWQRRRRCCSAKRPR